MSATYAPHVRLRSILLVAALVAASCSGDDDTGEPTSTDPDTSTTTAPLATAPTETVATNVPEDTTDPPSGHETTQPATTAYPTTTQAATTTTDDDERMALDPLGEARARWEAAGVDSYDFTIRYTTEFLHGTYRISVSDGVAVSAERVPPRAGVDYLTESELPTTIDEVFDRVEREVAAPVFDVEFDDELGYPAHVFADPIEGVVDDEVEFFIEDFVDRTAAN